MTLQFLTKSHVKRSDLLQMQVMGAYPSTPMPHKTINNNSLTAGFRARAYCKPSQTEFQPRNLYIKENAMLRSDVKQHNSVFCVDLRDSSVATDC